MAYTQPSSAGGAIVFINEDYQQLILGVEVVHDGYMRVLLRDMELDYLTPTETNTGPRRSYINIRLSSLWLYSLASYALIVPPKWRPYARLAAYIIGVFMALVVAILEQFAPWQYVGIMIAAALTIYAIPRLILDSVEKGLFRIKCINVGDTSEYRVEPVSWRCIAITPKNPGAYRIVKRDGTTIHYITISSGYGPRYDYV